MRACAGVVLVFVLLLGAPRGVQAQDAYTVALEEGREAARLEHYEAARLAFERALAARPTQEVRLFLARVASRTSQFESAYRHLQLALRGPDGGSGLSAEDRVRAQALLQEVSVHLGVFRLVLRPEDGTVTVDGQPPRLEPDGTLLLPVGEHRLVARRGDAMLARTLVVPNQREGDLVFDLTTVTPAPRVARSSGPGAAPPPVAATPSTAPAAPAPAAGGSVSGAGLALAIAGGVAVAAGAVFMGLGWSDASAVDGTPYYPDVAEAAERAQWMIPTGYVVAGVGLAALGVGVVVLIVDGGGERSSAALRFGPGGLELRGRF